MRNLVLWAVTLLGLAGCTAGPEYVVAPDYACPPPPAPAVQQSAYANPIFIPVADSHCAFEQVVDVIDDYFRIEREEPVRVMDNMVTEGSVITLPEVSPTIFEPWRHDTVDPAQRVENTLQSMRRRAVVRVIPAQGGHLVDFQVYKELEDVLRPERATAGAATFRYDSTLTGVENPVGGQQALAGWIAQGRDAALEQHLIADLLSRCGQTAAPVVRRGQDAASCAVK